MQPVNDVPDEFRLVRQSCVRLLYTLVSVAALPYATVRKGAHVASIQPRDRQ